MDAKLGLGSKEKHGASEQGVEGNANIGAKKWRKWQVAGENWVLKNSVICM
jgi:hypothetical protein